MQKALFWNAKQGFLNAKQWVLNFVRYLSIAE